MKILKYTVLSFFILNIPSVFLQFLGAGLGSMASYLSFILLTAYYILSNKTKLNLWMIVIGLLFFSISSIVDQRYLPTENKDFIMYIIKYFITVICGYELLKHTTTREMTFFLLLGSITIILQMFFFNNPLTDYGRYYGFYINPNVAGFICLSGYGLSFAYENRKFRLILQAVFTLMGVLTFSRTFILLWLLTNLLSVKIDIKNVRIFLYGFGLLTLLVTYSQFIPVKNPRLAELSALLDGKKVPKSQLNEDSRAETWSQYYGALADNPFWGYGFNTFSHKSYFTDAPGVHNSFLKVWGEAGILVFIIFTLMYLVMIKDTLHLFKSEPHLFLITIAVVLFLTTNHNFFETGYILFISMWIQAKISEKHNEVRLHENTTNLRINNQT